MTEHDNLPNLLFKLVSVVSFCNVAFPIKFEAFRNVFHVLAPCSWFTFVIEVALSCSVFATLKLLRLATLTGDGLDCSLKLCMKKAVISPKCEQKRGLK